MTREEAIEKIEDMKDYIIREHSPNDVFVSHMNEAIKVLLARPHGEWIPCAKRLPDRIGEYLVTDYRGNVYCSSFDYILREKCFNYEDDGYPVKDNTVVAWMPLPEPYKEEGDEK